jgi:2,4-dienoyl-CoA reductase (NADPH2)
MLDRQLMHAQFPTMLSPLRVAGKLLRNRVVMGSMHTRLENEPDGIERQQAYFAERAKGGVAMIVTGGYAPNWEGRVEEGAPVLNSAEAAHELRPLTETVRANGALMLLQILHAGRYARHPQAVGASAAKSPIHPYAPRPLSSEEVERTVDDFARCAELARAAGFDGVEVMGSEGYFINQFLVPRTNTRDDEWGGDAARRRRLAVEIVRRCRTRVGPDFILMYRISALDLVQGGSTAEEIAALAREVEAAGADILNTGIGWHEAKIPTVAYFVPRAAWRDATRRLKEAVAIPVMAANRINMPQVAEELLAAGDADLIQMARPLLADPAIVNKAAEGRTDEINTCIACNQACLDLIFREKLATCLVNPRAGRELEFDRFPPSRRVKRVAVVGAGAAGMACAIQTAERGHAVTLFEAGDRTGGQLNYASEVPSKQEFRELKRYFDRLIERLGVDLRLRSRPSAQELIDADYDDVVVATGVAPRTPGIPGIDGPNVLLYSQLLAGAPAGRAVAILGAGGIGFDVAAYLLKPHDGSLGAFQREWGVDVDSLVPGGLLPPEEPARRREVYLLQRSNRKFGSTLGPSTGWILREEVRRHGVHMIGGCEYLRIDPQGIDLRVAGEPRRLEVDTVVVCAGQESVRDLCDELFESLGERVHVIGGAHYADELDAMRAIDQGVRLALSF